MDDTDEKARRNLVIVSAAIVFMAWLRLAPLTLTSRLIGADAARALSAFGLWSTVLAVVLYLGYRYWFAPETATALKELQAEWRESRRRKAESRLRRHIRRYERGGVDTDMIEGGLAQLAERLEFEKERDIGSREGGHLAITFDGVANVHPGWPQSGTFTVVKTFSDGKVLTDSGQRREIRFNAPARRLLTLHATTTLAVFSRSCTHVLVPIALWAAAFAICAWRLVMALI